MLEVYYFAAARAAAGVTQEFVSAQATLGELAHALEAKHTGTTEAGMSFADVLARCSFLVDGQGVGTLADASSTSLNGAARVDVLPPFAGG